MIKPGDIFTYTGEDANFTTHQDFRIWNVHVKKGDQLSFIRYNSSSNEYYVLEIRGFAVHIHKSRLSAGLQPKPSPHRLTNIFK